MAILFPPSPYVGETYVVGARTWVWNGVGWQIVSGVTSVNPFIVKSALITNSTASTNTTTGALQVIGGVGIGGEIHAGGDIYSNGHKVLTTSAGSGTVNAIVVSTGLATSVIGSEVTLWSIATLQNVTDYGNSTGNPIYISNTSSQALQVDGGMQVGSTMTIGDRLSVAGEITSDVGVATTGTIYGVGIYDTFNRVLTTVTPSAGTGISINGLSTSTGDVSFAVENIGVTSIYGSSFIQVTTSTGSVTVLNLGVLSMTSSTETTVSASNGIDVAINVTSTLQNVSSRGASTDQAISISNTASSTSTFQGALTVAGGVGIGGNLNVAGSMAVYGPTTFSSPVTFNGTATYVLSTNTVYTDNIVELHVPPFGVNSPWTYNDGKDIGLRYHYYNKTTLSDDNAALVLANDSQLLEFYGSGAENTTGTFIGASYGGFKTGAVYVDDSTNATTSSNSGALQVNGGASIGGDLWTGGTVYSGGSRVVTVDNIGQVGVGSVVAGRGIAVSSATGIVTITNTGVTDLTGGTDITVSNSTGSVTINNASTLNSVTGRGNYTNYAITISNATDSSGTVYGALVVAGGVGVSGNVYAGAVYDNGLRALTQLTVAAGTGLSGGGPISATTNTVTLSNAGVLSIIAGTDTSVSTATGNITIWNTSTLQSVTGRGATTASPISITNTTPATSTTTGALQVAGGLGVQGNIWAGTLYSNGLQVITLSNIPIYAGPGIVVTVNTSTGDITITNIGVTKLSSGTDITLSATTGSITVDNISTLDSVAARGASSSHAISITDSTVSTSTTSGALTVAGGIGVAGDVNIGGNVMIEKPIIYEQTPIPVGNSVSVVLNSFDTSQYRVAKYIISVTDNTNSRYQATEILLVQDGVRVALEQTSVFSDGDNILTFSTLIVGSTVYLRGIGTTSADNSVKIQTTYITV